MGQIAKNHICKIRKKGTFSYKCSCTGQNDPSFPSIRILAGSWNRQLWFDIPSKNYLWYNEIAGDCWVMLRPEKPGSSTWLLGDPFLFGYYSIYDSENQRVGLVGPSLSYSKCSFLCDLTVGQEKAIFTLFYVFGAALIFFTLFFSIKRVFWSKFTKKIKKEPEARYQGK